MKLIIQKEGLIGSHRNLFFVDVTLTVPEPGYDPVRIQNFETDLPLFQHHLGSLSDFVEFNQLSLKSSGAIINAKVSLYRHAKQRNDTYISVSRLLFMTNAI
jgi:hypothetical protein